MRLPSMPRWMRRRQVAPEPVFKMTLEKHGNPYAVRLAGHPSVQGVIVVDVSQSEAIRKWNEENHEHALQMGHVIMEVNGMTDPREMLHQMANADRVTFIVNTMPNKVQLAIFKYCRRKLKVESILEEVPQDSGDDFCAICHEDMENPLTLAKLPCGHRFHRTCVEKWLIRGKLRCPMCNGRVELPEEEILRAFG